MSHTSQLDSRFKLWLNIYSKTGSQFRKSSLPGAAVSQVKIDGVQHEFSTIPDVKEDVTEIIMNIKSLAIKNNSDEPKTAYIDFEGEGVVTAY